MKLTGKLKEQVENAKSKDEKKIPEEDGLNLKKEKRFKFRIIIYILATVGVLSAFAFPCHFCGAECFFDSLVSINYFDLLLGQVANTLIVLSLTSVLSSNFGQIYWVDIKSKKLVEPFLFCFVGITTYLLTAIGCSIVSYTLGFMSGIMVSAVWTIFWLMVLTGKMIGIYFGRERLKKKLSVEYRRGAVIKNSLALILYARNLGEFNEKIEQEEFPYKKAFRAKINKEIKEIKAELDKLGHFERLDSIPKYKKELEDLRTIDLKIEEYTRNAIRNNNTEVVKENIGLLVESASFDTFMNLLGELFDWDEKYALSELMHASEKNRECAIMPKEGTKNAEDFNRAWLIEEKIRYFKRYALQKLISHSGEFDAIQKLLSIYDPTNKGQREILPIITCLSGARYQLFRLDIQGLEGPDYESNKNSIIMDLKDKLKKIGVELKCELTVDGLGKELKGILQQATTKDLRSYYLPIQETFLAYKNGEYETVDNYLRTLFTCFLQDRDALVDMLKEMVIPELSLRLIFSYITYEEKSIIDQLIDSDKENMVIPEKIKKNLSGLSRVEINNFTSYPDSIIFKHEDANEIDYIYFDEATSGYDADLDAYKVYIPNEIDTIDITTPIVPREADLNSYINDCYINLLKYLKDVGAPSNSLLKVEGVGISARFGKWNVQIMSEVVYARYIDGEDDDKEGYFVERNTDQLDDGDTEVLIVVGTSLAIKKHFVNVIPSIMSCVLAAEGNVNPFKGTFAESSHSEGGTKVDLDLRTDYTWSFR